MHKEGTIVTCLIIFSLLWSFFPTLYYIVHTPAGTIFPLIHNSHPDYYANLHFMRQGYEGKWLITGRFTPESYKPQFVQTFLAVLGHLTRIAHLELPLVYTLARLILGAGILIMTYQLVKKLSNDVMTRLAACFFSFLGTSFWWFRGPPSGSTFFYPLEYWTGFDTLARITFLPHHIASILLLLLSLYLFSFWGGERSWKIILPAGVAALSGFINPAPLLTFFFTLALFVALTILTHIQDHEHLRILIPNSIIVASIALFPLLYLYGVSHSTFPWTSYRDWEAKQIYPVDIISYILSLGPAFFLGIIGSFKMAQTKKPLAFLLIAWFIAPFFPLFILKAIFANLFPISNMRFFQSAHYIPVGIMGGVGLISLVEYTTKRLKMNMKSLFLIFFVPILIYSAGYWYFSLDREIHRFELNAYNIFLPKEFYEAFDFLNRETQEDSVILPGGYLANLIPAFTHNRSFWGHLVITSDIAEKDRLQAVIFAQKDTEKAREIINLYNISYLLFSLDTPQPNEKFIQMLGFHSVFKNTKVSIYQRS